MGYAKTQAAIERVRVYLDAMTVAEADLTWPTKDPLLAYRIRQGIAAAKKWKVMLYAGLAAKFVIRTKEECVVAELRDKETFILPSHIVLKNISGVMGVVGAAIKHNLPEMGFPDASLDENEMNKLKLWANKTGYEVDSEQPGVTLRKIV